MGFYLVIYIVRCMCCAEGQGHVRVHLQHVAAAAESVLAAVVVVGHVEAANELGASSR